MNLKFWETETYTWTDYRKYLSWINEPTKTFLWNNKEVIVGSLTVGVITLLALRCMRKPVAQKPNVTFETTGFIAGLTLEAPAGPRIQRAFNFIFCVDTSGSMSPDFQISQNNERRETQVKKGISDILEDASKRAKTGANFDIAIVGFNNKAHIISAPKNIKSIIEIKGDLEKYSSDNTTDMYAGLLEATNQLETMAKTNQKATNVFIALTDGEGSVTEDTIKPIRKRLAAVGAHLYAIGIGATHKEKPLQRLARDRYIDTTKGISIVEALKKIYDQTVAQYSDIKLSTTQLKAGTWSVNGTPSVARNGRSECDLGPLEESKRMEKFIQIHGEKLDSDLPLSTVKFDLSYKDPRGIPGQTSLRWRPDTTVKHALCKRAQNYIHN